jgi:hypothetical protein
VIRVPGYRSRAPGFDSRHYQIFREVCLERGPLSLVSTTEELPGRRRAPGFNSRHYQIFREVVGLERGPFSLVSTTEELPGRKRAPGFDSRHYQIFREVVGLERGPFSLVSTTEELPGRKSSGSCLEIGEYGHRDSSRLPRDTLYPEKLALTSRTKVTVFSFSF